MSPNNRPPPEFRAHLPPLPDRIARLRIDARGYPVPYFVAWVNGQPDHRIVDAAKKSLAVSLGRCWICGEPLGRFKTFFVGPMCAITRTVAEPPSHADCAEWTAQACPFLTRPLAHRRLANRPEGIEKPPGLGLERNPGCVGLWVTRSFSTFWADRGREGVLFTIGPPEAVAWYAEGRLAARAEVLASIESGLPALVELAQAQDAEEHSSRASTELERRRRELEPLLPAETPTAPATSLKETRHAQANRR